MNSHAFAPRARPLCIALLVVVGCGGADAPSGPSDVASVAISGAPTGPLLVGATVQLIATPVNSSGAVVSSQSVSWRSSDPTLATVNTSGVVLAVGAGPVTITASVHGKEGTATLDLRAGGQISTLGGTLNLLDGTLSLVVPPNAVAQTITVLFAPTVTPPANGRLVPGTAYDLGPDGLTFSRFSTLTIRYNPAKLPSGVTEAALQLYVANAGVWSQVAGSVVNISARTVAGNIQRFGTYAIAGTPVDRVTIGGSLAGGALYSGQSAQLTAATYDVLNNVLAGRVVTWTSSDGTKATVDNTGKVTGVSAGTVTITATSDGKSATTSISILARVTADWSQATEWSTFQGNAVHSGYVPISADPGVFRERWVTTFAAGTTVNPVVAGDGSVFASTTGYFVAGSVASLDIATGSTRWSVAAGANQATMAPMYAAGTVYFQTNDLSSYFWGVDGTSGFVRFRVRYDSQWSVYFAPVMVGQVVYMGCGGGDGLCAQRASDGVNIWFAATNQYDGWSPTVANGVVYTYTGEYSPKVIATDASNGKSLYEIPDPHFDWITWTMGIAPVFGGVSDLVATQNQRLVSFDLANRKIGWELKASFVGQPTVAAGVIYVVNNNQVEARSESDGSLLWLWIPPEGIPTAPMIATKNLLFVSTAANTYAVDLTAHKQVWSYPAGGKLSLSSQGVLLIAQGNGKLAAISAK